jgi:hypothetical protein
MTRRRARHLVAASLWVAVLALALWMLAPVLTALLIVVFYPFAIVVMMRKPNRSRTRISRDSGSHFRGHRMPSPQS